VTVTKPEPLERADARLNRRLLLQAAADCVAEKGTSVSALDIAERAGVSVATLYRRFTTKQALIEQVLIGVLADLNDAALQCLADPDPWVGLSRFITTFARMNRDNQGLAQELDYQEPPALAAQQSQLRSSMRRLTDRAQQTRAIRTDITWQDIAFIPKTSTIPRHSIGLSTDGAGWERYLALILDGLRTPEPTSLPGRAPRRRTKIPSPESGR